jgi:hypothetical protein
LEQVLAILPGYLVVSHEVGHLLGQVLAILPGYDLVVGHEVGHLLGQVFQWTVRRPKHDFSLNYKENDTVVQIYEGFDRNLKIHKKNCNINLPSLEAQYVSKKAAYLTAQVKI